MGRLNRSRCTTYRMHLHIATKKQIIMKQTLTYQETLETLRLFYNECAGFWSNQKPDWNNGKPLTEDQCIALASADVARVNRYPFAPMGPLLNVSAKERFLSDGGWYAYYKAIFESVVSRIKR